MGWICVFLALHISVAAILYRVLLWCVGQPLVRQVNNTVAVNDELQGNKTPR